MLEYLRNAADKPLAKFLMFVLIFSFVGWGAAEWIFGAATRDTALVSVGDSDISVAEYNNERSRQLSEMTRDEQRAVYADPARAAALNQSVMSKLTTNRLAMNRARDLGFVVSDKRIADEIKSYPQFQVNGEFSPYMFDMVLQGAGMNENDVATSLRGDILRNMTLGGVNVPVHVPDFMVDAMYNARYAKRDVKYATVKYSDYNVGNPTSEQLRAYYVQNPQIVPETRSVSYVFVAADTNKPDVYDAGFKKAQEIEDMIISGDSMRVAAQRGGAKYAEFAKIKRGEKLSDNVLNDDLVAKLFSMEPGNESELIELKNGFVILRVDAVVPEHNADFADVEKSLVGGWKKSEQRKLAYVDANEMLIAVKDGKTIKNVKDVNVSRTEGAPLAVLNAAFAGNAGDNVIAEDEGAFYVVSVGKTVLPKSDANKKESVRQEAANMITHFVQDDYARFLRKQYPVKLNEKVFNRFIAK